MQPAQPTPRIIERLVLIGFMGAGKSTLGPILAERLGWRFVDADQELEAETGTTIASHFSTLGEPAFRQMETDMVARLLDQRETVIALGGGAVESEANCALFIDSVETYTIFLRAPLEILIDRCECQPDASERPVLRQREALLARYQSRLPRYESAHLTVDTEGLSPQEVAHHILSRMLDASTLTPIDLKAITT